jgi:hypothetical protein
MLETAALKSQPLEIAIASEEMATTVLTQVAVYQS